MHCSIAQSIFPVMCRSVAPGLQVLKRIAERSMELLLFLAVPMVTGILFYGKLGSDSPLQESCLSASCACIAYHGVGSYLPGVHVYSWPGPAGVSSRKNHSKNRGRRLARGPCGGLAANTLFRSTGSRRDASAGPDDFLRAALYSGGAPAFRLSPRQHLLEANSSSGRYGCLSGGSAGELSGGMEDSFRHARLRSRAVYVGCPIVRRPSRMEGQVSSLWVRVAAHEFVRSHSERAF